MGAEEGAEPGAAAADVLVVAVVSEGGRGTSGCDGVAAANGVIEIEPCRGELIFSTLNDGTWPSGTEGTRSTPAGRSNIVDCTAYDPPPALAPDERTCSGTDATRSTGAGFSTTRIPYAPSWLCRTSLILKVFFKLPPPPMRLLSSTCGERGWEDWLDELKLLEFDSCVNPASNTPPSDATDDPCDLPPEKEPAERGEEWMFCR